MIKLLFLLFKTAKLGKILLTLVSMLVMIWVYQTRYGLPFSVGFVLLILVHEMGHIVAARQRGLAVSAPLFIPFVGAYIALKAQPHNVETEAYVAIAGPLAGTLGALACYALARHYDSPMLLGVAYAGFFMNLFNLLPLSPLDGGRIAAVLSPRIWLAGVPILIAAFVYIHSPLLILIGIMALPHIKMAWHYNADDPANLKYYAIAPSARLAYVTYYFALAIFLAVFTTQLHRDLS